LKNPRSPCEFKWVSHTPPFYIGINQQFMLISCYSRQNLESRVSLKMMYTSKLHKLQFLMGILWDSDAQSMDFRRLFPWFFQDLQVKPASLPLGCHWASPTWECPRSRPKMTASAAQIVLAGDNFKPLAPAGPSDLTSRALGETLGELSLHSDLVGYEWCTQCLQL
jgi:hypothetical protein